MPHATIKFLQRRRLMQISGALPVVSALTGLIGCGGGGGEDTPQATVTDIRVAVSADVKLHVREWKTKNTSEVIVLLAGLGGTAHSFDSLAPALARHARVLAVTRRGYGQSDKPTPSDTHRYDPATLVADLISLFDAQGIDRALLAGHSIAGNELTLFAGTHPKRLRGLVYLDTSYDYQDTPSWEGEMPDNPALEEPEPTPADRASWAAAIAFGKRVNKNWPAAMEANLRDTLALAANGSVYETTSVEIANAVYEQGHAFSPDYAAVSAPALVVLAEQKELRDLLPWIQAGADAKTIADAATFVDGWRKLRRKDFERLVTALPGCQRLYIDNSNHSDFFIEYQAEVVRVIESLRWP